jgi:hypothetical protein
MLDAKARAAADVVSSDFSFICLSRLMIDLSGTLISLVIERPDFDHSHHPIKK